MKYCVLKNTTMVIDGSENPIEIMLENALAAGFSEGEVEILTAQEYEARKAFEPVEPQPLSIEEQLLEKEAQILELKKQQFITNNLLIENNIAQLDLIEYLIEIGVI